jgi:protein-tyrosine phosphatase
MIESDRSRATNGASRIVPRLWMGPRPPEGRALAQAGFDVLVLCAMEYQPSSLWFPYVHVVYAGIDDAVLTDLDRDRAIQASTKILGFMRTGKRVLVTCNQGRNRSGLVVALTLMRMGCTDEQAIQFIRERRHHPDGVLVNPSFVEYLQQRPMRRASAAR